MVVEFVVSVDVVVSVDIVVVVVRTRSSPYESSTVCPSVCQSVSPSQKFSYFPSLVFSDFLHQVSL